MANDRRKSDKKDKYIDRTYKIAWSLGIAFLLYIVVPLRSEIKDLRKETLEIYKTTTKEINEIRKETASKISALKDQIIVMFKNKKW